MKQPTQTPDQQYHGILLARLQRLIRLQRVYRDDVNALGERMLSRAITATYGDCLDAGIESYATPIMRVFDGQR